MLSCGIEPFHVDIPDGVLSDLADRIARTRWPSEYPQEGWAAGVDHSYLKGLLASWATFDWPAQQERLNELSHFRADVHGTKVHFIHERGRGPDPRPIVLTHGWPSSFLEHLDLLPRLTDPAKYGGDERDAFDVVVMSLPGYGFSDPLPGPQREQQIADVWRQVLVEGLGYERFFAHGSDVGAGVTAELGRRHPDAVIGIHLSAFYLDPGPEPYAPVVADFLRRQKAERADSVGYSYLQQTRPSTLRFGLTDSPAGLAAWIVDVFRSFSDCGGDLESRFSRDHLLSNLTIYWATRTIASSIRGYYDYRNSPVVAEDSAARVTVPAGFAVFADHFRPESARPPRELAEFDFNVDRWQVMPRGGHFAALEEPDLLAEDIRAFCRPHRNKGPGSSR